MKRICHVCAAVSVLVFVCGCNLAGISDQWRTQVDKSLHDLGEDMRKASLSIPGAYDRDLLARCHSADPKVRDAARAEVQSTYGLTIEQGKEYEGSVWFDWSYEMTNELRAAVFRAPSPNVGEVRSVIDDLNPTRVRIRNGSPESAEEIRKHVRESVDEFLVALFGTPKIVAKTNNLPGGSMQVVTTEYPELSLRPSGGRTSSNYKKYKEDKMAVEKEVNSAWSNSVAKAEEKLMAAILPLRLEGSAVGPGQPHRSMPWNVFDDRQYLFVVIPREDWLVHRKDLKIKASVYRQGATADRYDGLDPAEMDTGYFDVNAVVTNRTGRSFVWLERNLTLTPISVNRSSVGK